MKGLRLGGPESDVRPEAYIPVAQSQIVDGGVYAATGAVIVIAGLIAAWLPARRAARVDPLVALRAG